MSTMDKELRLTWELGELPDWLRLLPLGRVELVDGRPPFEVDTAALKAMAEAFAARGTDLVIDYEHQSLKGGKAPAAGWIKELSPREDGLWARVEWTPQAREYLSRREYRYFSPVLRLDPETRRPVELLNVALTNVPAIRGLHPLVAKWGEGEGTGAPLPAGTEAELMAGGFPLGPQGKGDTQETACFREELRARLGLKSGVPEGQVYRGTVEVLRELAQELGLPPEADVAQLKSGLLDLKSHLGKLRRLEEEVNSLRQQLTEHETQRLVEEAILAGKITPAQKDWALCYCRQDRDSFRKFVDNAPRVVPVGERLKLGEEVRRDDQGLTPEELALCRSLNLAPEAYAAAKGLRARDQ